MVLPLENDDEILGLLNGLVFEIFLASQSGCRAGMIKQLDDLEKLLGPSPLSKINEESVHCRMVSDSAGFAFGSEHAPEILKLLLEWGMGHGGKMSDSQPLAAAAVGSPCSERLLALFAECGMPADLVVDLVNPDGSVFKGRLVHVAAIRNDSMAVKELARLGACMNGRAGNGGSSALHCAVCSGAAEACQALLSCGADIEAENSGGLTPLMEAAALFKPEMVALLLAGGADANAVSKKDGGRLLHFAAATGYREVVREAIAGGGDPNAPDFSGRTPLAVACLAGSPESVKLLLEAGADPFAAGGWGFAESLAAGPVRDAVESHMRMVDEYDILKCGNLSAAPKRRPAL